MFGTAEKKIKMSQNGSSHEDLLNQDTRRSSRATSGTSKLTNSQIIKDTEVDYFFKCVRAKIELHNYTKQALDKRQISFFMEELDNIPKLLKDRRHIKLEISKLKEGLLAIKSKLDLTASTLDVCDDIKVVKSGKCNLYSENAIKSKLDLTVSTLNVCNNIKMVKSGKSNLCSENSTSLENFDLTLLTNHDFITPNDNQVDEFSQHFSVQSNRNRAKILQNIKLCDQQFKSEDLFDTQPDLCKEIYLETPMETFSPTSEVGIVKICSEVKNLDISQDFLNYNFGGQDMNKNLSDSVKSFGSDTEVEENDKESSDAYEEKNVLQDCTIVDMELEPDKNDTEDKHLLVHNTLVKLTRNPNLDENYFLAVMDDLHLLIKDVRGELITKFKELDKKTADGTVEKPKAHSKSLLLEDKSNSSIIIKSGEKITEQHYQEMVEKLSGFYTLPGNTLFEIKQEEITEMPNWEDFESFNLA